MTEDTHKDVGDFFRKWLDERGSDAPMSWSETFEFTAAYAAHVTAERDAEIERLNHLWMQPCSGCFEGGEYGGNEHNYPWSEKHHCRVGAGCDECGGTGLVKMVGPTEAEGRAMHKMDLMEARLGKLEAVAEAARRYLIGEWTEAYMGRRYLKRRVILLPEDHEDLMAKLAALEGEKAS